MAAEADATIISPEVDEFKLYLSYSMPIALKLNEENKDSKQF